MDDRFAGRLYRRIIHKYFLADVGLELRLAARREAADYIRAHLGEALLMPDRYALLDHALQRGLAAHPEGLVCEFGVAGGKTLSFLAKRIKRDVHGFDSFEGLPDDWSGTAERAGRFSRKAKPPRVPANARLHVGWFDATLPRFLQAHPGPLALLHLDADLYSSTKTVLTLMRDRIRPGTAIVFDEYLNYPGWRAHEHKAFQEFVGEAGLKYRYIGFSTLQGQAAAQIAPL